MTNVSLKFNVFSYMIWQFKIKRSVTSPQYKVWVNFFRKKGLHEGTLFFGKCFGRMYYMGTNEQIMQRGKLMVKKLQRPNQVSFLLLDGDLDY